MTVLDLHRMNPRVAQISWDVPSEANQNFGGHEELENLVVEVGKCNREGAISLSTCWGNDKTPMRWVASRGSLRQITLGVPGNKSCCRRRRRSSPWSSRWSQYQWSLRSHSSYREG